MKVRDLIYLLQHMSAEANVGVSVEEGANHTDVTEVVENPRGVWICVLPESQNTHLGGEERDI